MGFKSFLPKLVDVGNQHHAIEYRDTKDGDKTHGCRHGQVETGHPKRYNTTDSGKGYIQEDEHSVFPATEGGKQHEKNESQRNGNHYIQPRHRPLLIFKLSAVFGEISCR